MRFLAPSHLFLCLASLADFNIQRLSLRPCIRKRKRINPCWLSTLPNHASERRSWKKSREARKNEFLSLQSRLAPSFVIRGLLSSSLISPLSPRFISFHYHTLGEFSVTPSLYWRFTSLKRNLKVIFPFLKQNFGWTLCFKVTRVRDLEIEKSHDREKNSSFCESRNSRLSE